MKGLEVEKFIDDLSDIFLDLEDHKIYVGINAHNHFVNLTRSIESDKTGVIGEIEKYNKIWMHCEPNGIWTPDQMTIEISIPAEFHDGYNLDELERKEAYLFFNKSWLKVKNNLINFLSKYNYTIDDLYGTFICKRINIHGNEDTIYSNVNNDIHTRRKEVVNHEKFSSGFIKIKSNFRSFYNKLDNTDNKVESVSVHISIKKIGFFTRLRNIKLFKEYSSYNSNWPYNNI